MSLDETRSVLAGRNAVREALEREPARIEKVLLEQGVSGGPIDRIRRAASRGGVQVQYVPEARLLQEAGEVNHQGVLAIAAPVRYQEVEEMLSDIAPRRDDVRARKPLLVLLDRITDTHNFGAILRSAAAMGGDGVIVPERHMAPVSAATIKASSGAARRIPIARTGDMPEVIKQLKERSYWIAGAAGSGDTTLWDMDWDRPLALVLGSEEKGLRRQVAEECDFLVSIPMTGPVESLNVSVAAGILLVAAACPRTR